MEEPKNFLSGDEQFFAEGYHPTAGSPLRHLIRAAKKMVEYLEEYEKQDIVFVTVGHSHNNNTIGFMAKIYGIESKKNKDGKPWTKKDELMAELERKEKEIEMLKQQIKEKNK
ncbi:MAG TPA: hypothetical protein PLX56_10140 [bacterium]|nr:hypothetical protein [bacterium]HQO92676.1 hypothetical protein [bacterium]